jgi:hypothetical protein
VTLPLVLDGEALRIERLPIPRALVPTSYGRDQLILFGDVHPFMPPTGRCSPSIAWIWTSGAPPEVIVADSLQSHLGVSREQLVDLAILVGTDFNDGVKGIGPKKALQLVQAFGHIERMPEDVRARVPQFAAVREIYLAPPVTSDYALRFGAPDESGLLRFLCQERGFSRERVLAAVARTVRASTSRPTSGWGS